MKRKILAIIFILNLMSFSSLNAQWAMTYGADADDATTSIQKTADGGYIVVGSIQFLDDTASYFNDFNFWILKLTSDGAIEWQKTYGANYLDERAYSIQQTKDGGYIVGGFQGQNYNNKILIIKLASDGNIEWHKHYGNSPTVLYSLQQTSDGGYIVAGSCGPDTEGDIEILILKLSFDGAIEWQKTYGGSEFEVAYSIQQTIDGGFIAAGESQSFGAGGSDIWILKLASDGYIEWQKIYGGSESERANSIQQTNDGGYIVAGHIGSYGAGQSDFWILKLSPEGYIDWNKTYGGSKNETAYSIQQTFDGGYIIAGETQSFGGGQRDIWSLKLNSGGDIEWQKAYGGRQDDVASFIQQTYDGGFIVSGSTDTYGVGRKDFLLLKLFSNGEISPSCTFIYKSNAEVSNPDILPLDTYVEAKFPNVFSSDFDIISHENEAIFYSLCSGQYTLSIEASAGGTTDPLPGTHTFDYAERISLRAIPDSGYKFAGWSGDISEEKILISLTMDSDKSLQANFELDIIEEVWERVKRFRCFIATAAYGSPIHPHVRLLQEFRDKFLMSSKIGRQFVNSYYKYSPRVAEFIEKHKALRIPIRICLLPAVALGYSMIHFGPVMTVILIGLTLLAPFLFVWGYIRKRNHKA
jgi:uncharacterized delta-60 repeat protein